MGGRLPSKTVPGFSKCPATGTENGMDSLSSFFTEKKGGEVRKKLRITAQLFAHLATDLVAYGL
jgi:hypothetical protein